MDLVGFFLPPVIDIINSKVENSKLRYWVSMLLCFVVGVLVNLDKIKDPQSLLANAALVFTSAQVTYHTYWEKSDVRAKMFGQ